MTFTRTLYFSPGAVSLATHIAFEEAGLPYRLEPILIKENQQRSERYLQIHPLGRLPAVEVEPGVILTETPALLGYLADQLPALELLPKDPLQRARANEWMSLFSSSVHISFVTHFRPARYTADEAAMAALKVDGKQRFFAMLQHVEARLPEQGYIFGERFSLVDSYAFVFYLWGRRIELPVEQLPRYTRLASAVMARPAVRRALEQEGFAHLYDPDRAA
jgi:glutathione S-transferase